MRILFSSWPAYGHLLPMLRLARAARRAGHDDLISSGSDVTGLIEQRGFAAPRGADPRRGPTPRRRRTRPPSVSSPRRTR